MADHHDTVEPVEAPISISHLFHTLRAYFPVIVLSMIALAVGYLILAILLYLLAPAKRVTSQAFRIEFSGATEGQYPNGTKFSAAEVISTPVLMKVFRDNELERFTNFAEFSRSIFILEANAEYETLASEYQARLSDPKLTAVDRDRLQREFQLKRASLSKNEYAINYVRTRGTENMPEPAVRKVLSDILSTWSHIAVNDQHVLSYRVAVLSPKVIDPTPLENLEPIISIQILRSKITRLMENVDQVAKLPSAELVRTGDAENDSLTEVRLRLEEILRFRLDPLVPLVRSAGVNNPASAIRFFETQLEYDQRQLESQMARAETIRQSLSVYANRDVQGPNPAGTPRPAEGDTVMPQLSDSFLDRLVTLTSESGDSRFRQTLVEEFQDSSMAIIPLQQAVAYDRSVLEQVRGAVTGSGGNSDVIRKQIEETRAEVRKLVVKLNLIHRRVSEQNLNPPTQLYTTTGTPITRVFRAQSLKKLGLMGILTMLIALPVIIGACFIHNRMKEEDRAEATMESYGEPETV
ncbi:MAG TPA: hypothetical protein VGF69_17515 [Thermoanaerobaculia bacterium]|jgi:hypothetical protein